MKFKSIFAMMTLLRETEGRFIELAELCRLCTGQPVADGEIAFENVDCMVLFYRTRAADKLDELASRNGGNLRRN